jgi:hypothetical protein
VRSLALHEGAARRGAAAGAERLLACAVARAMSGNASACREVWPLASCGTHGACDERAARCVCDPGWQLNPLAVDGVELCNQPHGFLLAVYTAWLVLMASCCAALLARAALDWRSERLATRTARSDAVLECIFSIFATCMIGSCRDSGVPPAAGVVSATLDFLGSVALDFAAVLQYRRMIKKAEAELGSPVVTPLYSPASVAGEKLVSGVVLLALVAGQISGCNHFRYVCVVWTFKAVVGITLSRR